MGRYSETYLESLAEVLDIEGGATITNYPWDPGGRTRYGIAENYWPTYWADGPPTEDTARRFYWKEFWCALRCPEIVHPSVRHELFEAAINCGTGSATMFAQNAYNLLRPDTWDRLRVDGALGPITVEALNHMAVLYPEALLAGCNFYQARHYVERAETPQGRKAMRGWFARRLWWEA